MSRRPLVKNIEVSTNFRQKPRRKPGETSYPITYTIPMADFDIWHHMFLFSYCQNLTMHRFARAPARVLDLGCGTGYWAIEAAKHWPTSKIYGFDIAHTQPQLENIASFCSLSERVEWVHGNFLDGLPFPTDFFDFVRISGLGLAIPEDEWQSLLEDVRRVLKAGAVLEIIEDDLLFPCSSSLLRRPQLCSPVSVISYPPNRLYKSKSAVLYERSNTLSERNLPSQISNFTFQEPLRYQKSFFVPCLPSSVNLLSPTSPTSSPSYSESIPENEHSQDHSRLKAAWDAMLAARFLSPNLLSVLPFYLTTSSFSNATSSSYLRIPLPPNSGVHKTLITGTQRETHPSTPSNELHGSFAADFARFMDGSQESTGLPVPEASICATMHLAKTVNTVRGCKEAIFSEYYKLHSNDALDILSRKAQSDFQGHNSQPHNSIVRQAFEVDWKNWEFDMIDRMTMGSHIVKHSVWAPSIPDPVDHPEWRTWRNGFKESSTCDTQNEHSIAGYNPDDLCRSMRIFIGFKT
ncbi:S-adenosyl-L-methionine-dependent methyltransferase [Agrocybe pediades]|nr:S-adenosyl-L-methionine-dependent methyltransferase [Agrocybe pediades]